VRSLLTPEEERIQSEIEQKYEEIKRELAKTYNNAGLVHFYEVSFFRFFLSFSFFNIQNCL
jgi:hypothetical protein